MSLYDRILNLLYPPKCVLCGKLLEEQETDLCRSCRENAPEFPVLMENLHPDRKSRFHFLDSFTAVWYYEGNVRESLLRYKFHGARKNAGAYGRLLAMKLQRQPELEFDVLTWAPVSRRRRRIRGYDQSQLLAQAVGREMGMTPVCLLRKTRNNPAQSGMPAEQRRANVLGVYALRKGVNVKGKRVLLLDDIFTTGSTAEECARVLLTAGAKEVHCAAIAAARK